MGGSRDLHRDPLSRQSSGRATGALWRQKSYPGDSKTSLGPQSNQSTHLFQEPSFQGHFNRNPLASKGLVQVLKFIQSTLSLYWVEQGLSVGCERENPKAQIPVVNSP